MKRFFKILLLVFTLTCSATISNAQTQWYKATQLAIKFKVNGYWQNWSNWQSCSIPIKFDLNNDLITIFSNKIQYYKVLEQGQSPYDETGRQILFYVIDGDGDRGNVRLRVENNGNSQIYIDFADVSWVYNVYRTQ